MREVVRASEFSRRRRLRDELSRKVARARDRATRIPSRIAFIRENQKKKKCSRIFTAHRKVQ